MNDTIRLRCTYRDGTTELRIFIRHPMETGARRAVPDGPRVPRHHITELECSHQGRTLLHAGWGRGVSRNPFLRFTSNALKPGDQVQVTWHDNLGKTDSTQAAVRG